MVVLENDRSPIENIRSFSVVNPFTNSFRSKGVPDLRINPNTSDDE